MTSRFLAFALIALAGLLLLPGISSGNEPACAQGQIRLAFGCADAAKTAERVRAIVRETMRKLDLRSAIVSVRVDDTPVLSQAWGESAARQPATLDMHWRIGSIGIAYLTTALLQLQDQGVLSIDDKLSKWFPDYPRANDITLAMLANSTSGYAEYAKLDLFPLYDDIYYQWSEDELIQISFKQGMDCEPGTCFSYSHANFIILGQVMAKASGKPLADLIRTGILEPLGMHETRSDATPFVPPPVLHAFSTDIGNTYQDSTGWSPSWTTAAGAVMTSTVPDVMRSAAAIATGQLISPKAYAQLLDPRTASLPPWTPSQYYGLGIFVSDGWIMQNPFFFGYSGVMAYRPAEKIAIAVTCTLGPKADFSGNTSTMLFQRIAQGLAHPPPSPANERTWMPDQNAENVPGR